LYNKFILLAKKASALTNPALRSLIVESLLDKKANDVVTLDMRALNERPADFFIIAHGDSTTQVRALYENVYKETNEQNARPTYSEGSKAGEWIVADFGDVVLHVFHREKREFYHLEDLWNDAKRIEHTETPPAPKPVVAKAAAEKPAAKKAAPKKAAAKKS
jgi:ribosome-associated protein